ncbi:MAG: murein biosynthesis integral membrane protein MurJ [Pyrinomonadaceae bacterium MAG19_C2-C3]|nr:murein biosynthesis integral membrane protein MurJ [Pyrinomonadaceae bacterium MAG19_C2-C3]
MTPDRDDETTLKNQPRDAAEAKFSRTEADLAAGETIPVIGDSLGETPAEQQTARRESHQSTGNAAFLVGAGILLSRIIGLVRQRVFAHYFGNSAAKDAFDVAFRIPNFLQNVFGEGALSASFIPVYAGLLARNDEREANRVAGTIFALLALVTSILVLAGVLLTPLLTSIIAYGFDDERRELTENLVRIFFPGAGLLVLSAWCLGVLNSHRRFFLSYTAPIVWNIAIIVALVTFGNQVAESSLAIYAAWGSVIGSFLQFAIQLPTVIKVARGIRPAFDFANAGVRTVVRNFFPVFFSRGVVQISAFVDSSLASLLPVTAVSALSFAQSIYTLPVSLFGMSISAAKLPAMSATQGDAGEVAPHLRRELNEGLRHIAFNVVPSVVAFLALGDTITAALYQTGEFRANDTLYVWGILAGSTIGLLASTMGRLYSSTYYALRDTRTPLRFAVLRVVLATVIGSLAALRLPALLGINPSWGVAGLTAASGLAGWVEFYLLRRTLNRRIGHTGLDFDFTAKLWLAAILAAALGYGLKIVCRPLHPILAAAFVLGSYGVTYFAITAALRLPESRQVLGRVLRVLRLR